MSDDVKIYAFSPWRLSMSGVGPFRDGTERISFRHSSGNAANLFMIMAPNGKGKTTALEAIYFLIGLLDPECLACAEVIEHDFYKEPKAQLQLDIVIRIEAHGLPERRVLLSLSWGFVGDSGLSGWSETPLEDGVADYWLRLGYQRDGESGAVSQVQFGLDAMRGWDSIEDALELTTALREFIRSGRSEPWTGFSGSVTSSRPTVLYFASARDIARSRADEHRLGRPSVPQYRVAHRFEREGEAWASSLENLLVWYYWLSPDVYDRARELVNSLVFDGGARKQIESVPQKDPPGVRIGVAGDWHGLDRLSSGERNLTQFALRYGAHRTRFTILLIDEIELHLHQEFRRKLILMLKQQIEQHAPGVTVLFTSHDDYVIDQIDLDEEEESIYKMPHLLWR